MKNKVADNPPVAVAKAYDFVLWLVQKVENFPKSHRFTIGERLVANGLDLLTLPGKPFERCQPAGNAVTGSSIAGANPVTAFPAGWGDAGIRSGKKHSPIPTHQRVRRPI